MTLTGANEISRLLRRAARHPVRVVALSVLVALSATLMEHKRDFTARVLLHAVENNLDPATAPRPNRQLRRYVERVVFSRARLLEIIRDHSLYPALLAHDPELAVDAMRADIQVEVWRNDLGTRAAGDVPPSAHVAIGYRSREPRVATAVADDLAALLVDEISASRLHAAESAAAEARRELQDLAVSERLPAEMRARERELAALDLRAQLERDRLGLQFRRVDGDRALVGADPSRNPGLIGLLAFAAGLPLAALAVGALDRRIYDLSDVDRLGLQAIGVVGGGSAE